MVCKDMPSNSKHKEATVAILILDKISLKTECISNRGIRNEFKGEFKYDIIIINVYVPSNSITVDETIIDRI